MATVLIRSSTLAPIRQKLLAGTRLDAADGVALFECADLLELGELADTARRLRGGDDAVSLGADAHEAETLVTVSYSPGDSTPDRVAQLLRVREQQEETGKFAVCMPVPSGEHPTTGQDDLTMIAVARLLLDNVRHIAADQNGLSMPIAQIALSVGADDLRGGDKAAETLARVVSEAGKVVVRAGDGHA